MALFLLLSQRAAPLALHDFSADEVGCLPSLHSDCSQLLAVASMLGWVAAEIWNALNWLSMVFDLDPRLMGGFCLIWQVYCFKFLHFRLVYFDSHLAEVVLNQVHIGFGRLQGLSIDGLTLVCLSFLAHQHILLFALRLYLVFVPLRAPIRHMGLESGDGHFLCFEVVVSQGWKSAHCLRYKFAVSAIFTFLLFGVA